MAKQFLMSDVDRSHPGFPRIFVASDYGSELVLCELPWQKHGLQQTTSGYGAKLTSSFKINFEGKLYRLYHTCYGNTSSCWFTRKGEKIYVN